MQGPLAGRCFTELQILILVRSFFSFPFALGALWRGGRAHAVRRGCAAARPCRTGTTLRWSPGIALCCAAMVSVAAAPTAHAAALPLSEVLRQALASHPALSQRKSEIDAARFDVKSAEWKRFPNLSVEASQLLTRPAVTATNNSLGAQTVRLDQRIYTFGRIESEIDAAGLRQRGAEWSLAETEQELMNRVVQSYMELVRQGERLRISQRNIDEHQRLTDLIKRRLASGVSSEVDAALAEARLAQARAEATVFRAAAQNARLSLEQLAGNALPGDAESPVRPGRLRWAEPRDALERAMVWSPTLRRLSANVSLAETDIRAKNAAIYPEVVGRYERFSGSASVAPFDRFMVVLQYQPGAGLSQIPQIDAARLRAEGAVSGLEAGKRDLTERVYSQFNEAGALLEQLGPARAALRASGDVMESYVRQYTAGRKTWQEVLNAQRELTQAAYTVADTEAAATNAFLRLDILTGDLSRGVLDGGPAPGMFEPGRPRAAADEPPPRALLKFAPALSAAESPAPPPSAPRP